MARSKDWYWECRSADVLADQCLGLIPSPDGWNDEGLSCVGLYWLMLNVMHQSPRRGYLINPLNGSAMTVEELARNVKRSTETVKKVLQVIMDASLFSTTQEGVIYSRAMVAKEEKKARFQKYGKRGGNPSLVKKKRVKGRDNPTVNGRDNPTVSIGIGLRVDSENIIDSAKNRPEEFERFWEAYPRGRKGAKALAYQAWLKAIKKTTPEALVVAAAEYASSPVGRGEYVKGPAPWLNGECWLDDRESWNRGGPQAPIADAAKTYLDWAMQEGVPHDPH